MRLVQLDHPLGNRISVVGSGGKSSLAKALGAKKGLPAIELDAIYWLPGWKERPRCETARIVRTTIESIPAGWICDGNYFSTIGGLSVGQADTVVWVKMPWRVVLWRIVLRSIRRAIDKRRICGDNYEQWSNMFGPDALWLWHLKNPSMERRRGENLAKLVRDDTPVIRIDSPRELDRFYEVHGLERTD